MPPETHEHEHKSLQEEINDVIELKKSPEFQTYSPVKQTLYITAEILECGCEMAHVVKDRDLLIKTLEEVWEKQIVPIDLPINDALEFTLEMAGRQMIRPVITAFYDKLELGR